MTFLAIAIIVLTALGVAGFIAWRSLPSLHERLSSRFTRPEHLQELHAKFGQAIERARRTKNQPVPPTRDPRSFVTGEAIAVVISSFDDEDHTTCLQISLSQKGEPTSTRVASQMGFFLISSLAVRVESFTASYTDSGVHHLILQLEDDSLRLRDYPASFKMWRSSYKEIPFKYQALEG
jgi:hypothetical protein